MYQNLLFHVYIKFNMFRGTHRPSSGAQNCTSSIWVCIRKRLLDVVVAECWQRPATTILEKGENLAAFKRVKPMFLKNRIIKFSTAQTAVVWKHKNLNFSTSAITWKRNGIEKYFREERTFVKSQLTKIGILNTVILNDFRRNVQSKLT